MSEEINWADCDIEGSCRVLEANGYLLTATSLKRTIGRIAELTAALTDSQQRNSDLAREVARLQGENAQQAQTILYLTAQVNNFLPQINDAMSEHVNDWIAQPIEGQPAQHTESIVCPNCNHIEQATVLHTAPWYSHIHDCGQCGYTIMESEWLTVEQMIKDRGKGI